MHFMIHRKDGMALLIRKGLHIMILMGGDDKREALYQRCNNRRSW